MNCTRTDFHSHSDDYAEMITQHHQQQMTAGAPLGEEISWGPSDLLLRFLASNLTTVQLGPNYPFKNDSLSALPAGPVPMLITKIAVM